MEAKKGIPQHIAGLSPADIDDALNRLESLVRDGVEPRIFGIRMRAVATSAGPVIVVRMPKSWNPPHRISAGGSNRFHVRNSAGVHEASVEELRVLFTLGADARNQMTAFRADRINKVTTGRGPARLPAGPRLFLHLMPLAAFGQLELLDVRRAYKEHGDFWPIGAMAATRRYNLDGVACLRGGEVCHGYTQLFRNGIVEATMALNAGGAALRTILYWGEVVKTVGAVPLYLGGLQALDVPAPIVVMISLQGFAGAKLGLKDYDGRLDEIEPFPSDDPLLLPDIVLNDFLSGPQAQSAPAPALDALWNAAGFARCAYYDAEGNWRPPR
jgi:hypothetical protein